MSRSTANGPLVHATAKVDALEILDDGSLRATLLVLQVDDPSWNELLNLFAEKQRAVDDFFERNR